ncbi:Acetoacetate decarboxylase [Halapricum desulfuricans]|uniref:Acetoacetate decarboxylase n=1 Tax=Halapricum desulfuricans TaxID=2841257 RepID=A0A897NFQ3_9EURY|nr:acetoacetate decarboxylase family protein [Halapricum desulfuricans]QSG11542.1 Acetoacetate decarboxylase [Halapricum desulfuricans]
MTSQATISTGHTFQLPAQLSASIVGAVFSADRGAVATLLPAGLEPIRATRTRAALTVLAVTYDRVGEDTIDPYDEVGVLIPAVETGTRTWPYLSGLRRGVSGYVYTLPVSTEPARAFGVDIWGYPKLVAEIDLRDTGRIRHATVIADGQQIISFEGWRPPTIPARLSGYNYTVKDEQLLREKTRLSGSVGMWPRGHAELAFGKHPIGQRLANVAVDERPLYTVAADCDFEIEAGSAIQS